MSRVPPNLTPMNGVTSNAWISTDCASAGVATARIAKSVRQTAIPLEDMPWKDRRDMRNYEKARKDVIYRRSPRSCRSAPERLLWTKGSELQTSTPTLLAE